ncbi:hypothetical protein NC652_019628 [Populus alba x Populus x berolinensis]|uniref:Uncharacterized protein n=1 Tax=Populus alba x Populus x berolinensis TaxID=444605 RepID=A0AAD6QIZ6_9ROSI|nr:hypothetical protein NC652_019628 [Populus alba x Populus x berolinensis]KAJ6991267.1 hypothetical protein NC653_019461 [Populus alba x Populus x berolinensis]
MTLEQTKQKLPFASDGKHHRNQRILIGFSCTSDKDVSSCVAKHYSFAETDNSFEMLTRQVM